MKPTTLQTLLCVAAAAQLVVAILNLFLVRMMNWHDIAHFPLLIREVFHVHSWFISITLTIFAVMTWCFSAEMAGGTNVVATWLAAAIGLFWGFRVLLQFFYYSASHWRGLFGRTIIHIILVILYGGLTAVYLFAAKKGLAL